MDLVGDILNYEKLLANKLELESIVFDLRKLCEELLLPFKLREREKNGLEVHLGYASECPVHLQGDPLRIKQIINNFLSNAFKFTEYGSITLHVGQETRAENDLVVITVTDTGIGINEEKLSELFQDYQQADAATSRNYGGTGLGLSISKKMAELMGGEVGASSNPGQGSSFYFRFPLVAAEAPTVDLEPEQDAIGTNPEMHQLRVLVAEDNPVNQMVIKGYLKRLGVEPVLAEDGELVMKYFGKRAFDLILMDINMPLKDGMETSREIRAMERERGEPPVAIHALTADAIETDRQSYLDAGMNGALSKPINLRHLAALLESVLAEKGQSSREVVRA